MRLRRRHIAIIAIQIMIIAVVVFFPESEKERRFSSELSGPRPFISMETRPTGDAVLDAMNNADLFGRYRFTRAMGSESPYAAFLILPDAGYSEHWHMEVLLTELHKSGFGALILDMRDAGEFIPLKSESGTLRTTEERYTLFTDAACRWLKSLGFEKIILLSMGSGFKTAWNTLSRTPQVFIGWIDISGRPGDFGELTGAPHGGIPSLHLFPRFLFFQGARDPELAEIQRLGNVLADSGIEGRIQVLPETGRGLLDADGKLDSDLEASVRKSFLQWAEEVVGN